MSDELLRLASSDPKWSRIRHYGSGVAGRGGNGKGGLGSNNYGAGFSAKAMTSEMLAKESVVNIKPVMPAMAPSSDQRKTKFAPSVPNHAVAQQVSAPVLKGFVRASSSYQSVSISSEMGTSSLMGTTSSLPTVLSITSTAPGSISNVLPVGSTDNVNPAAAQSTVRKRTRWDT